MDTAHSQSQSIWCCTRISAITTWISIANNSSGRLSTSSFHLCLSKHEWTYWTAGTKKKVYIVPQKFSWDKREIFAVKQTYIIFGEIVFYFCFDIIYLDKFTYLITIWRSNLTPRLMTYNDGMQFFVSFPSFLLTGPTTPAAYCYRISTFSGFTVIVQCRKNSPWRIIVIFRQRHL